MNSAAGADYVSDYLRIVEDVPEDLGKIISKSKELDLQTFHIVAQIETLASESNIREIEAKLNLMSDLKEEKLQLALQLKKMINLELETFESKNIDFILELNQQNKPPASSTPLVAKKKEKRGRKPKKKVLDESNLNESGCKEYDPASDLMMLAKVAVGTLQNNQDEPKMKKVPVTKRLKKTSRKRKASTIKKSLPESEEETDFEANSDVMKDANQEVDENEPLYCICNRVSFGLMVECENESCAIEWFHFKCVGLKADPKGKWYCPKCRGKKSNVLKKELVA